MKGSFRTMQGAEAESKVWKSGLTDDQLKIFSTIGATPHIDGQ